MSFANANDIAEEKQVAVLGITEDGYPPYLIADGARENLGIVGDVIKQVLERIGVDVEVVLRSEKRLRIELERGTIDFFASAYAWEPDAPASTLWSSPIAKAADHVFMLEETNFADVTYNDLIGKKVAVHVDYVYPSLDDLMKSGKIEAIGARNFQQLLKLVDIGRARYGILDKNVARWVFRTNDISLNNKIIFSEYDFDRVEYRLLTQNPGKWRGRFAPFNRELAVFMRTQAYQDILNKYK